MLSGCAAAAGLPVAGITHVAFRVTDQERTRAFYEKVLGFEQPFTLDGGPNFIKINDRQFIELYPGLNAEKGPRLDHICFETTDAEGAHRMLQQAGVEAGEVQKAKAGNVLFSVKDPDGHVLEFLQYYPGSKHMNAVGKALGPNRVSARILHAAVMVRNLDTALAFYRDKLGFEELWHGGPDDSRTRWVGLRVPGERGDVIELMLAPEQPSARQLAAMQHIGLEVQDVNASFSTLQKRGLANLAAPRPGRDGRAVLNIADPDGTRLELAPGHPAYSAVWHGVANRLIMTPPESYPFNWGEGVQMIGLMKIHERTRDPRYADYVEKWAGLYLPRPVGSLLDTGPQAKGKRPGYCGYWSPATAILYLYRDRRNPAHLKLARQVNDFILHGAERGPEGGLGHWQGSHQLWVDTLYMACPLLSGLGKMEGQPAYIADAAKQIEIYARHLQDPKTGLFYHMWDWETGTHSPELWGRGNGWVLMSIADTMEVHERKDASWARLREIASKMVRGLAATQDKDAMWHTVMDDPKSYPEASATAMFTYGVLKLVRLGVLDASSTPMVRRAWTALNQNYVKDGVVLGVSAGTDPGGRESYTQRPVGTQTWGTGAYLMAGSEIYQAP
jgi:unsaturated rhamnogalacturonyl hydrolase